MKKLLLVLAFAAFATGSFAQNYYSVKSLGVATSYDISGTTGKTMQLDGSSASSMSTAVSIPFTWSFYGNQVTQYKIAKNGYITFDVTATSSVTANTSIPASADPNNAIYALWDNFNLSTATTGSKDQVFTWTYGNSPNRVHVIQWFSVTPASGTGFMYASIRLYEAGDFDIVHDWASAATSTATVGCEDANGTTAKMISSSYNYPASAIGDFKSAVVYTFKYGTQPAYDASVSKLSFVKAYGKNSPIPIKGTLVNYGANDITSFDLNYSVNGGTTVTQNVSGVNILGSGEGTYDFTHGTDYTPSVSGACTINVWASNFNSGNADNVTANDQATAMFTVYDKVYPRVLLHEEFTSSTCNPCASNNVIFDPFMDGQDKTKYAEIKYQMSWPNAGVGNNGDPYYTSEGNARRNFYLVNGIPDLFVDGTTTLAPGGYTSKMFDDLQAIPSVMNIKANHWQVGQSINVNVDITSETNLSNVKLFIVVNEKTTSLNAKTNTETEFYHVMKKIIGATPTAIGGSGITISSLTAGTPYSTSKGYTFGANSYLPTDATDSKITNNAVLKTEHTVESFSNLEVVVFVQDPTTKEVFQAANSTAFATGIKDANTSVSDLSVFPSPASDMTSIQFSLLKPETVKAEIVDVNGKLVKVLDLNQQTSGIHTINVNTSEYAKGLYMVRIQTSTNQYVQRFIVAH